MMRWLKVLIVAVLALAVINSCAGDAQRGLGRAMVDAGTALGGRPAHEAGSGGSSGGRGGGRSYGRDAGSAGGSDGSLLVDAGQALIDGGRALLDAADQHVRDAAAEPPLTATNGSRIKLRRNTYAGADGTRYEEPWLQYYDTMLGVTCYVYTTSDGKQRCVPQPSVTSWNISTRFADASCTSRLAPVAGSCEPALYAYDYGTSVQSQCEGTGREISRTLFRFYRLGAEHTGQQYEKDYQGVCKAVTTLADYQHYVVGAEMQPSEFVEFTSSVADVP